MAANSDEVVVDTEDAEVTVALAISRRESALKASVSGESAGTVGSPPGVEFVGATTPLVDCPEFAAPGVELIACTDSGASRWGRTVPVFESFEPAVAPPLLTTCIEFALPERFDEAVVGEGLFGPAFDALDGAEFPPAADDPVDASAHATLYPAENSAAPTPRATANPPTRPTKREAPMIVYLPTDGDSCLCGG